VHGIAWCERSQGRKASIDQSARRFDTLRGSRHLVEAARSGAERRPDARLDSVEMSKRIPPWIAIDKLRRELRRSPGLALLPQRREHFGKPMRQKTQWHCLARTDTKPAVAIQVHLAVTAQSAGAYIHRLDHGAPAGDHRSLGPNNRLAGTTTATSVVVPPCPPL